LTKTILTIENLKRMGDILCISASTVGTAIIVILAILTRINITPEERETMTLAIMSWMLITLAILFAAAAVCVTIYEILTKTSDPRHHRPRTDDYQI
jgi:hypothetical protein